MVRRGLRSSCNDSRRYHTFHFSPMFMSLDIFYDPSHLGVLDLDDSPPQILQSLSRCQSTSRSSVRYHESWYDFAM
jgi:hypothetical protein